AAAPGRRHGEPDLVRRAAAIHGLQQESEIEAELHLDDCEPHRGAVANRGDVAAADLALAGKPRPFEEALYRRIEVGFGHCPVHVLVLIGVCCRSTPWEGPMAMPPDASDPYDLRRFVDAQDPVFAQVCAELRRGRKEGHWMWFVFPQL